MYVIVENYNDDVYCLLISDFYNAYNFNSTIRILSYFTITIIFFVRLTSTYATNKMPVRSKNILKTNFFETMNKLPPFSFESSKRNIT